MRWREQHNTCRIFRLEDFSHSRPPPWYYTFFLHSFTFKPMRRPLPLLKPRGLLFLLSPPPSLFDPISICDEFVSEMNNSNVGTTEEEEEEEEQERELDVQSGSSDTLEILVF